MLYIIIAAVILLLYSILASWYIYNLLKRFIFIDESVTELYEILKEFSIHIDIVYKMENYFGDDILENLLKHAKNTSQNVKNFRLAIDSTIEIEEEEEEGEEIE
tara:strand:+ start:475 stop:786 length:312 start_codon:yes stop_codon:yes gene_type:complete